MARRSVGWLQLSDLHRGQPHDTTIEWSVVREALLRDLRGIHERSGPWDFVFFTGDIAYSGTEAEYRSASEVIDGLLGVIITLQHQTPILLGVPGNHDLKRPPTKDAEQVQRAIKNQRTSFARGNASAERAIVRASSCSANCA